MHFVTVDDVEAMPIVILSLNSMSLQMVYLPNFAIKTEPKNSCLIGKLSGDFQSQNDDFCRYRQVIEGCPCYLMVCRE